VRATAKARGKDVAVAEKSLQSIPTNLVATVHAVFAFVLAARGLLWPAPSLLADDGSSINLFGFSTRSQFSMAVSCGYFIWDLIVSVRYSFGAGFIAHAIACFFVYANSLPGFLHYHGLFFLLFEASSPFLHVRWYLYLTGRDNSVMYTVAQTTFGLAFLVVRLLIGWPVSFYWWGDMLGLLSEGVGPWWTPVIIGYLTCNIVLNLLNGYWFFLIVKAATGGDKGQKEGTKANANEKASAPKKSKKAQD